MKNNAGKNEYIVLPSELHSFIYCPRYYFFERYMPHKLSLKEKIRLVLGRIFHMFYGLLDKFRGYSVESPIVVSVGNVKIVGRPDSYRIDRNYLEVIERKSGRGPRRGAWLSDVVQASTYAFALSYSIQENITAKVIIRYRNRAVSYAFDSDLANTVLKAIEDLILVKYYGILPASNPGKRCEKCPFKKLCDLLEKDPILKDFRENLLEPGDWIAHEKAPYIKEDALNKRGSLVDGHRERSDSKED